MNRLRVRLQPLYVAALLGLVWLAVSAEPASASRGSAATDIIPVAPLAGATTNAADPKIDGWIRDLGDKQYTVRQKAADELRKIGYPAVAALERAAQSDDPEVADTARSILKNARLGVSSAWPKALAQDLGQYEKLAGGARDTLIRRVVSEMHEEAVPFLLLRLAFGNAQEGQSVFEALTRSNDERMAERIAERLLTLLKEPKNEWQARAVAWAYLSRKQTQAALRVLVDCKVKGDALQNVVQQTVMDLLGQFKKKDFEAVAKTAADVAPLAPDEGRLLYLQAAAWRQLGKDREAADLEKKALKLNPREEGPHYTAGDMLMDLGLDDLSWREWDAILRIAPADDVYDINAHMRMGQLAARGKRNQEAADHFEAGLKLYRQKQGAGHGGYGMLGTSEKDLEATIRQLREEKEPASK